MTPLPLSKKVLIVSSWAPPRPGGSAQQLYNFFSQFDPSTYAIYTRRENLIVSEPGPRLPCPYNFFPVPKGRTRLLSSALEAIRTIRHGRQLIRIKGFDVIYTTSDAGKGLCLGLALSFRTRTPLIFHFLDIYRGNNLPWPWGPLSWLFEPILLMRAVHSIFPNEAIYEEYCRRYAWLRSKFSCVNNVTSQKLYAPQRKPITTHAAPYSIVVTGSVYWAQEESVLCLAKAVKSTDDLYVNIYVPQHVPKQLAGKLAGNTKIRLTSAAPDAMPEIQTSADILFIPLARPGISPIVTQTAVPGKLPEYLVSGRPIILQAPEGSFMAHYAQREGFAHVVTSYDPRTLRDAIHRVASDTAYQRNLVEHAQATFTNFHDITKNAAVIAGIIESVATTRRA